MTRQAKFKLLCLNLLICCLNSNCKEKPKEIPVTNSELIEFSHINQDSIDNARLMQLGGVSLVGKDTITKCNLTTSRYIINKKIPDSLDLAFVIKLIGERVYKQGVSSRNHNCPYPVMCVVYFYKNLEDVKLKDNLGSYSVTPATGTDVFINPRKLLEVQ